MKSSNSRTNRPIVTSTTKNMRGFMKNVRNSLRFPRRRSLSIGLTFIIVAVLAYSAPWSKVSALFAPTDGQSLSPSVSTLISPTGDGGFETGVDMTANGWTVVNNATNGWFAGTATFSAGTRSAYISNTSGATYTYTNSTAAVSHFYRDVTVPAGETGIVLSFKLKGDGDLFSGTFFDKMMVYTAPTSFTPTTAAPASSGTALPGATLVYVQAANFGAAYTPQSVLLPGSLAGTTFRLIFTFHCDTSTGTVPSSVDEISLTSQVITPLTGTKTIPGDYANFTSAINDLNLSGVGVGGVTFNVAAGSTFPEDTPCITANGSAANPIVFQKNGAGANPVVQPTGGAGTSDFGICISGSDWVTFDGIDVSIATGSAVEFGYLVRNVTSTNGAQNNTVKNVAVTLNRANTASIGILQTNDVQGGGVTPASTAGGNSFNKYYNLNIQNAYSGLYLKTLVLGFDTNNEVGVTGAGTTTIGGATPSDIGGGSVTTWGIRAIAQTNPKIFKTEVRNVGVTGAVVVDGIFIDQVGGTTDCFGNQVHDIRNTSTTATNVIAGIRSNTFNIAGPINRVYNNFVWNITSGYTGAASASRQIKGISVQSNGTGVGATQMIDFNSVRIDGTASPNISSTALAIGTTSGATMNIRNNILANFTGAQAGIAKHYAWDSTATALTGIAGSVSDHNVLYSPNTNGFVGIGNTTDRATLTDWRNATGQDAHSKGTDPVYVSATDLHIGAGATEVESGGTFFNGAITWVTSDYDSQVRDLNFPDIGADEGVFTAAPDTGYPDILFTVVPNSTNTVSRTLTAKVVDPAGVPVAGAGLPVLYYRKGAAGAFTAATGVSTGSGNYDFTITYASVGGVVVGDIIQYYFVAQDNLNNVGSNPSLGTAGFTTSPPAAGTPPTTPFSYAIAASFTGSINVGTTEPITSLTNAGGLFAQINTGAVTGNITINLTSDLTVETGANVLNATLEEPANSNYTITIKPSGAARVISGTGPAAGALIKLNGVDRVTFDGSTSGGTDRSLTITNNASVASTAAIWVASAGGNGAQNNTIKNCVINAGADQTTGTLFTFGVISSSSAAILTGGTANNGNNYTNNLVKKASVGIASIGGSSAFPYTGTVISSNQVGPAAFGSDEIGTAGILIFNEDGIQVVDNEVRFVGDANFPALGGGSRDRVGIVLGSTGASWSLTSGGTSVLVTNANVSRNKIHDILESTTFSAVGIVENSNNSGSANNNLIANNMIWNVKANGTSPDQGVGIGVSNGNGDRIVYNSIYMTGDIDPGTTASSSISSFGISLNTSLPLNLTLHDNISWMDLSSNTGTLLHSAINVPVGFAWGTGGSNRNDLFALAANPQAQVGTIGGIGGTYFATLALWQAASGQDANSISADPLFTSPTDLHVAAGSPVVNAGSTIVGVANDIDNDFRPGGTAAEIGADELVDATSPDTTIDTFPPNPSTSSSATFTFSGTDTRPAPEVVTGFDCKLDAAAFAPCTSPVNLIGLSNGSHTFQVRAKDGSGNVDPSPASYTWTIDTVAPIVTGTTPTNGATGVPTNTNITINFSELMNIGVGGITLNCGGAQTFTPVLPQNGVSSIIIDPDITLPAGTLCTVTVVAANVSDLAGNALDGDGNGTGGDNFVFTFTTLAASVGPVTVTATAGTPGPTDYPTLKDAIDAINAGTHQGAITVAILSNTTETAPSVLNSSGAGSALYTSILIRPSNDGVTVAGPSLTGRGLIELNGADNVTIDGDNPNTAGTNRNLTIQNTAVSTVTFAQVIRIALATTIVTSADNCTIKNLNILGNATGRNIAAATTTTGSENASYGILATGGASTVSATTAPAAIAALTTTIGAGATANSLTIQNNNITTAARAVAVQGSAATVFPGLLIENNTIGNPTAGAVDQVYSMGVTAQGTNNAIVRGNTVYIESFSGTGLRGLEFGSISATGTTALFEKNKVLRVRNNNVGTFGAYGINLGGGNTHTVQNNFVADVRNDQTAGTGAFSTTFGALGIRVAAGTGHKVLHNSVHLFGAMPGVISTNLTVALGIVATGQTGMDVRNNIFSNQMTGGPAAGTRHAAVFLPSGATVTMNLTWNNNAYYQGTDPLSRLAQVGTTIGAGEYLAANFDPSSTSPATNFRAYTSPLSAANTNDNASFATSLAPPFTSNTDLHIPAGTQTPLESGGAGGTGVTDDIDAQIRAATPDIGADEFAGVPPPANDIAATLIVLPSNGSVVLTGTTLSPQASFKNVGTAVQTNVNVQFTITGPGGYNYSNPQTIPTINPNQTITVTFAPAPTFTTVGAYVTGAAVTTPDSNAANDTISGGFTVASPLGGTYTVGTGGNFTSLTNPGGVFDNINSLGATSNLTINVTSDLTGESGSVPLNQVAGGFTVTIKPFGAARSITGTATAVAVIKLNEADNVTIDGSLSGGTDRSLSVISTNTGASTTCIWLGGTTNGAQNNTIKNLNLEGGTNQSVTNVFNFAIIASSSTTLLQGGTDLDNNVYRNNFIKKVSVGIISIGGLATNMNQNTQIVNNLIGPAAFGVDEVSTLGILIFNENLPSITGNELRFIGDTALTGGSSGRDHVGISLCTGNAGWSGSTAPGVVGTVTNANISGNRIHDIVDRSTFSAVGIVENCTNAGSPTTNTIANNFIYNIQANGTTPDQAVGIALSNGNGDTVAFNSVYMTGDIDPATTTSANYSSFGISAAFTPVVNLNLKDNTSTMDLSSNTGTLLFSAINIATGFTWGTGGSNFNNWFAPAANTQARVGTVGGSGGTFHATLAAWQTATTQDGNSFSVDPLFVSGTDLHLQAASPLINVGTTIVGITTDIDGDIRPTGAAPEIGADEFVPAGTPGVLAFSSPTYTIGEAGVQATITVSRTGGSSGTVGVSYATVAGGTATGGGACGGTVDYVNTSGTLTFPDTNTSQSFNIPICSDTLDEADETVNMALSSPTGGATLGTQSTAVLTITDDDPVPSIAIVSPSPLPEGNVGTTPFTFNVNLSAASGQTVSVHYQTADGTATVGNNDYVGLPDTVLTFTPGQTSLPVTVQVNGDLTNEPDENFFVNLTTPVNATIGSATGTGTILNDDPVSGASLSINDVRVNEGNTGTRTATFTVTLTCPGACSPASVHYSTSNGTATAGSDYVAILDTLLSFPASPGTQTQTFNVTINGDTNKEPNETFHVDLFTATNATISDNLGIGIIVDEDRAYVADFDHDRKTDLSVFRPSEAIWYISQSTNGVTKYQQFGANGDRIVPGDYDGDGVTDLAVFHPSNGVWSIERSSDFGFVQVQWGLSSDLPVQADYDGDSKTDIAVFRPSTGVWYVLRSSDSQLQAVPFGAPGDKALPGDFDGDGKSDFGIFRPSGGTWYVQPNTDVPSRTISWGSPNDIPVSGDFDGDGSADIAVFRPSNGIWYIVGSLNGAVTILPWGTSGDIPVVGDYDGDGTSDIAVWRPSDGNWYVLSSEVPGSLVLVTPSTTHWGQLGDKPVPASYVPEQ